MPKGSAVADVEAELKKEYGSNKGAIYGVLNKIGLMHGNKPTAKGLKKAKNRNSPEHVLRKGHTTHRMPK